MKHWLVGSLREGTEVGCIPIMTAKSGRIEDDEFERD
jgi:hypothetical protein